MSQVNQTPSRPASSEPGPICRAPAGASARAAPPVQARDAFDAALERATHEPDDDPRPSSDARPAQTHASTRKPRHGDNESERDDAFGPPSALNPFAGLPTGPLPTAAVAVAEALPGAAPQQMPLPTSGTRLSAESLPGQTAIGGPRQFNLSLPADAAALSLRLTQTGATHWQLRLGADAATRQQLAPHVERLRDRLRQRQGKHTADFDLEDDGAG
ncbi:hypothetical protein [Ottowia testudinis]|uniref:Flagellar hook-length control protein FliK n=1 Tax=Ottowia testudinis TaxID=2816950 RepID=A0A975CGT1_9BURK|nr:hypothetical protein [Ottowia testudinis]QTD45507.1 hypothetical protein J1M35_00830 [Ottowia testudinis]